MGSDARVLGRVTYEQLAGLTCDGEEREIGLDVGEEASSEPAGRRGSPFRAPGLLGTIGAHRGAMSPHPPLPGRSPAVQALQPVDVLLPQRIHRNACPS